MQHHLSLALEKIFEDLEMPFRLWDILPPGIEAVSYQQKSIAGLLPRKRSFYERGQCLHIL
jgi:hypothetical protein